MKKCLYLFAMILMTAGIAVGQSKVGIVDSSATVSVNGKAEIFVEPDVASMRLEVTHLDKREETAKSKTDAVVKKILAITKKYNLPESDVGVTSVSFDRKYRYVQKKGRRILDEDGDETGEREFIGFESGSLMRVKVRNLEIFSGLFKELLASGVKEIDDVEFETSELRKHKDQARALAMKAAREKANALAGAIGQTIGKAIKIQEGANRRSYVNTLSIASNSTSNITLTDGIGITSESSGFSPGPITVDASVSVVFLLN